MPRGTLAVTGASGFVGRHLIRLASAEGWEVVGAVRSERAARIVVEAGGQPAQVANLERHLLTEALTGARAVVHLAQIGAERGGSSYEDVNLGGTRRVIEAARRAAVPRILFFSGLGVARYGMSRRCTNRYFLSKLAAEVDLYRSGLEVAVFRPSYVLGPEAEPIRDLLRQMAAGEVERIGDGTYRVQPIGARDAAAAVLAAVQRPGPWPAVFDLVGPEPVSFQQFVERLARVARAQGRALAEYRIRELPIEEAERQAAAGGYRGMLSDELDCLLCDEVSDPRPLEALLGRFLTPLDDVIATAVGSVV